MARQELLSPTFWYTFGPHPPARTISSGAELRIVCADSDNTFADGTPIPPAARHQVDGAELFAGNPMAGPLAVTGAEIGDAIAVELQALHLDCPHGQTLLAPDHGLVPAVTLNRAAGLADELRPPRRLYRWALDPAAGQATLLNPLGAQPVSVPLRPFVGCIGVCPARGETRSTLLAGAYGGNMDLPALGPGGTILFPVLHRGALLFLGDLHAGQGIGEIIGGGIETSGRIDCRITLHKGAAPAAPRLLTATHVLALGVADDLRSAIAAANAHLAGWLATALERDHWDCLNWVSQSAGLTLGNLLQAPFIAAATLARDALRPDELERLVPWHA